MIIDRTMLCLTCTMISSVDLANYGVSCAKDWVSVNCGTILIKFSSPEPEDPGELLR